MVRMEIAGGAMYDALVALAAVEHKVALANRDARVRDTYVNIGAEVVAVEISRILAVCRSR